MTAWKYTNSSNRVVTRTLEDGRCESCLVSAPEYLAWLSEGNTPEPADPVPVPPIIVTPRQIRQALTRANLRTQVETAVAAGDQDIKDWWEFATQVEENHPMVVAMALGLNVDEAGLHDLFVLAKSL